MENFPRGQTFLSRDRDFYKTYLRLFALLALQNIITYSVNVVDNIMLGMYAQASLSGAMAVNQIQYILQQVINNGVGEGLVVIGSQFWGRRDTDSLQRLTGTALYFGWIIGLFLTMAAFIVPAGMVRIFTSDPEILAEGTAYLEIMRWSYLIFITTSVLLSMLRSVQMAGIAFKLSIMALIVNVGINRILIFGSFGFPEMGIRGAAVGTLIARILELAVLLIYLARSKNLPFRASLEKIFAAGHSLAGNYARVTVPCIISSIMFSASVALQTVITGHLSADAIAANSVAGTLFQYVKMIPIGAAAAASVMIGRTVGAGEFDRLRTDVRTLQIIFLIIGLLFGGLLKWISGPILSLYTLTDQAMIYAREMINVMAITSICTGFQMPNLIGIVRGGGDSKFVMRLDMIMSSLVTAPLSLLSAFTFHASIPVITLCMNFDQIIKVPIVLIKVRSMNWVKRHAEVNGGNESE